MAELNPKIVLAGEREAGAQCIHCGRDVALHDATAICSSCGAVHHLACWQALNGCGAYECPQSRGHAARRDLPVLSISSADLAAAVPLPPSPIREYAADPTPPKRPTNRAALWAFIVALLGIPLFGVITGLVAIVIACIALAGHSPRRRGLGFAVAAMLLGIVDVIGWSVGLSMYFGHSQVGVSMAELAIDPSSLEGLPDRIARALRANVLIQADFGMLGGGMGSGVILNVRDGTAYIVTNRHVIDDSFKDNDAGDKASDLDDLAPLTVMTVGQHVVPAAVEWIAPHGVDLAIISAHLGDDLTDVREATWDLKQLPHVGDPAFAIGNPHGLGWTHSAGSVSQIRSRTRGVYKFPILQVTAALNPGNSGGGLYDADGRLIGINTLTGDKRFAEGLGFAIGISTLFDLAPESLQLPAKNRDAAVVEPAAEAEAPIEEGERGDDDEVAPAPDDGAPGMEADDSVTKAKAEDE